MSNKNVSAHLLNYTINQNERNLDSVSLNFTILAQNINTNYLINMHFRVLISDLVLTW